MATTVKTTNNPVATPSTVAVKENRARMALSPSTKGAVAIAAYQGNITGKDTDLQLLVDGLRDTFTEVKGGDLTGLEAMLISQATALQTIFTSLARRAQSQEYQKNFESFLGLALKAQAQSRATVSALVVLKYPRQATFVRQANIAHGPQQVNNGTAQGAFPVHFAQVRAYAHVGEVPNQPTKLLDGVDHGSTQMDDRATTVAARSHQTLEAVGAVHRAAKR